MKTEANWITSRLLGEAEGVYGRVRVTQEGGTRTLWCDSLCHGSSYLEPAAVIGEERFVPGPIPEAAYHVGWLIAARCRPSGEVLMVGLGAGAGVIALCHEFPLLHLTVVEIDPEVISLARRHFPLLDRYERDGRIAIVETDIAHFVHERPRAAAPSWTLTLWDAYQVSSTLYSPQRLLRALRNHTQALWLNIVDSDLSRPRVRKATALLSEAGWEVRTTMAMLRDDHGAVYPSGNILVGTDALDTAATAAWLPFAGIDHPHAEQVRRTYRASLAHLQDGLLLPTPEAMDAAAQAHAGAASPLPGLQPGTHESTRSSASAPAASGAPGADRAGPGHERAPLRP